MPDGAVLMGAGNQATIALPDARALIRGALFQETDGRLSSAGSPDYAISGAAEISSNSKKWRLAATAVCYAPKAWPSGPAPRFNGERSSSHSILGDVAEAVSKLGTAHTRSPKLKSETVCHLGIRCCKRCIRLVC